MHLLLSFSSCFSLLVWEEKTLSYIFVLYSSLYQHFIHANLSLLKKDTISLYGKVYKLQLKCRRVTHLIKFVKVH